MRGIYSPPAGRRAAALAGVRLAKLSGVTTWVRRLGSKTSGFRYVDARGRPLSNRRQLKRIDGLRVPPAWRDVHIAASPASAIQAWGIDARGRKQYRYNDRAVERRELRKYHRVRQLAKELPRIRALLRRDARRPTPTADAVSATVLRVISETFCRVGGERYRRENGTFGITTLRKAHVNLLDGTARLAYTGKGRIRQQQVVTDRELVRLVQRQLRTPGTSLFSCRRDGRWRAVTARDVNAYLARRIGHFKAKDFRTWGGTLRAATVLAELGPAATPAEAKRNVALAMRLVSAELGNTPAICRASYVHPMVIARYLDDGETISLARSRRAATTRGLSHSAEERALIRFLDRHFPERRRKPREAGSAGHA
jgi:DNA topoisomerase-1